MRTKIIFLSMILSLAFSACSGIKLADNCDKKEKVVFAVLPFANDNYVCYKNIEQKLQNMCYDIVDGTTLLNEYQHSTGKQLTETSIAEFAKYAKTQGVDRLIYGNVEVEWFEGHKPLEKMMQVASDSSAEQEKDMKYDTYRNITGNYAIANCNMIETDSGKETKIFNKYKVKKVNLGTPNAMQNTAN